MKILHTVQRYYPDTGGSEEVVRQLSELLVSFGHEVVVATGRSCERKSKILNGVRIEEFECLGNTTEGIRGDAKTYRDFVASANVDIMMNYAAQIWCSDLLFELLPTLPFKRVFVPCGFSRIDDPKFGTYFEHMPTVLRLYDAVVYLSPNYRDKHFANQHGLMNSVVIPNGAALDEFEQVTSGDFRSKFNLKDNFIVLNVSNHSTLKNHRFFWSCMQELSNDNTTSVLIGNSYFMGWRKWVSQCYLQCRLEATRTKSLMLEGLTREDVVRAYVDADVFLFGSKVECSPLVMFESFASKTLFVTTDCGNVRDYSDVACVINSEAAAVDVVKDFRSHPQRYADRIEKGYKLFQECLNWTSIARTYESLYLKILDRKV